MTLPCGRDWCSRFGKGRLLFLHFIFPFQITNAISELDPNLRCLNLYGGVPIQRDFDHLRRGVEVLCATPGRLRDHLRKGSLTMKQLKFLVLDEADEMLKDDWLNDLEQILMDSPDDKQVILSFRVRFI